MAYYWFPKRGSREAKWYRAQWCRLPGGPDQDVFWIKYGQLREALDSRPGQLTGTSHSELTAALRPLHDASKRRAVEKSLAHGISLSDLAELYTRQGMRCAVSGIEFRFNGLDGTPFSRAFAPSMDRIDNAKGYTFDNVRLVCRIANFAMGTWGQKALEELAVGVVDRMGGRDADTPVCNASEQVLQKVLQDVDPREP